MLEKIARFNTNFIVVRTVETYQQGGLAAQGACQQDQWPEFSPKTPHGIGTSSSKLFSMLHVHFEAYTLPSHPNFHAKMEKN